MLEPAVEAASASESPADDEVGDAPPPLAPRPCALPRLDTPMGASLVLALFLHAWALFLWSLRSHGPDFFETEAAGPALRLISVHLPERPQSMATSAGRVGQAAQAALPDTARSGEAKQETVAFRSTLANPGQPSAQGGEPQADAPMAPPGGEGSASENGEASVTISDDAAGSPAEGSTGAPRGPASSSTGSTGQAGAGGSRQEGGGSGAPEVGTTGGGGAGSTEATEGVQGEGGEHGARINPVDGRQIEARPYRQGDQKELESYRHGEQLALEPYKHGEQRELEPYKHGEQHDFESYKHGEQRDFASYKRGGQVALGSPVGDDADAPDAGAEPGEAPRSGEVGDREPPQQASSRTALQARAYQVPVRPQVGRSRGYDADMRVTINLYLREGEGVVHFRSIETRFVTHRGEVYYTDTAHIEDLEPNQETTFTMRYPNAGSLNELSTVTRIHYTWRGKAYVRVIRLSPSRRGYPAGYEGT